MSSSSPVDTEVETEIPAVVPCEGTTWENCPHTAYLASKRVWNLLSVGSRVRVHYNAYVNDADLAEMHQRRFSTDYIKDERGWYRDDGHESPLPYQRCYVPAGVLSFNSWEILAEPMNGVEGPDQVKAVIDPGVAS